MSLPKVSELSELYKKAKSSKDDKSAGIAEAAIMKLAAAEAAIAEATTLASFVRQSN